jgi:hypothetical protein
LKPVDKIKVLFTEGAILRTRLLAWLKMKGVIVGMILLFARAHVMFHGREIRA